MGDRPAAARVFADLLGTWLTTGQGPQLWTTARNAAALLLAEGLVREAVLLLTHADRSPDATAVNEEIAANSGRAHVLVGDAIDADRLDEFRREGEAMSVPEVIETARLALADVAARE